MREDKRRRLEAKGWKIGTAQEFLHLSTEEAAYIDLKARLATGLRERRRRRSLTQADLAKRLQSSQSRIAKMEAGDPSVSLDLLIRSLLILGASRRELSRIIAARSPLSAATVTLSGRGKRMRASGPLEREVRRHARRKPSYGRVSMISSSSPVARCTRSRMFSPD